MNSKIYRPQVVKRFSALPSYFARSVERTALRNDVDECHNEKKYDYHRSKSIRESYRSCHIVQYRLQLYL